MTVHVRLLVVGTPENLFCFGDEVKSRHIPYKYFSLDRIIRTPIPVPASDVRDWRRSNWGSPHDAYNVSLIDGPGELVIEFDCREFPCKVIEKLISRYPTLGFSGIYEDDTNHVPVGFSGSRSKRRGKPLGKCTVENQQKLVFDRIAA